MLDITYSETNYKVPEDEIWKLTWKSPYKIGEITPAYDVRILGSGFTTREMGTQIHGGSPLDINNAGLTGAAAEIWVNNGTEFYLANDRIQVKVEAFKKTLKE